MNKSNITKVVNVMVVSRRVTMSSAISRRYTNSVPATMRKADMRMSTINCLVTMGSDALRGGCLITPRSTGSTPKLHIAQAVE